MPKDATFDTMKYQIGDRILLLHSNEEGEVVDILNEEMVLVDVEGVRFPVYKDQIDFPYFKNFTEKKSGPQKIEDVYKKRNFKKSKNFETIINGSGVWISFHPIFDKDVFDEDVVTKIEIHLLNQNSEPYHFDYQIHFKQISDFKLSDELLDASDFHLHDIDFEEMNDAPKFEFDFSLIEPNKRKSDHYETTFKLKAKTLFQKIEEMRLKKEDSFSFQLFDSYPDKIEEVIPDYNYAKGALYDVNRIKEKMSPPRSVIDLHIEKLTDDWQKLSNFEILTIQLNSFEKYYQLAVSHHQPNLIVIHGVGTGKLKNEIHEILQFKKEVRSFANQYHPNFGFGATEIFFQY
jgi:hypothetical protein